MISQKVLSFDYPDLVNWLRYEAGSSNPEYFKALAKKEGSLKLQQVPEEYAHLLLLLKEHKAKSYLELGVGNGGSFAMACFMMQETLINADAVDCLAYRNLNVGQHEDEIQSFVDAANIFIGRKPEEGFCKFHNMTTDNFFEQEKNRGVVYDIVFIDADHSYEGVRKDFANAQKHLNDGGLIVFHDIASKACPGLMRLWQELSSQVPDRCVEFVYSDTCGIGVIKY
jgi:predicted O-methyltransferase YrrM